MSSPTSILLLLILWTSLQDSLSVPSATPVGEAGGDVVSHRRTKRCACSSRLDSECHYFCHLDIIWINTQSKTTIYGLGGPGPRRRRAAARCFCANPADRTCAGFCVRSFKIQTLESSLKRLRPNLLTLLSRLVDGSHTTPDAVNPETENAFDATSETNVG